jgi:hypothetical protein
LEGIESISFLLLSRKTGICSGAKIFLPSSISRQTNGNFAGLGSNGNLMDSGISGTTFNSASQLVRLDADSKLPAIDGSQLTNLLVGATAFTDLTDAPASYTGQSGKYAKVKSDESGLEFGSITGTGDVVGPSSATADDIAVFDSTTTTGKLRKDGGKKISDLAAKDNWYPVASSKYTATPTSTSVLAMSDTSDVNIGDGIKYTISSVVYYAIITALTANTSITISGAPLSGDVSNLYVGNNKTIQLDFYVYGLYADATGDLLAADMNTYFKWQGRKAYLVSFSAVHKTADTTTNPKVNVKVNAAAVSTNDSNLGIQLSTAGAWVDNSAVAVNTSNYDINRGEAIEINCSAAGGTANAANLTVSCVFVQE